MDIQSGKVEIDIPSVPVAHDKFIEYVANNQGTPMLELLEPYKRYDAELRKAFAQQPDHPAVNQANILPVFAGHEHHVTIRARDLNGESDKERESYIMPLKDEHRKPSGSPAIVQSLHGFRTNFSVFSENALVDLDWSNVVVAGSAVVTSLLALTEEQSSSKRALRQHYHEQLAPASDVDLFLYGLTEGQAIEKIKQIERSVRDAILVETTTVRTKNAITIASQYPTRHVQIVLRVYKSMSEILTGFDVDCSTAAYDGQQVYASPRALVAFMTQVNSIDLTRRSPSYENRLSKYARRGFEVYWPNLDRSKIDPTIFERSFGRTEGLARLLVLEKLPSSTDREAYLDQRRAERGRPPVQRWNAKRNIISGNIKNNWEDEVAEWVDSDEMSNYHTFTVPYGAKFSARRIEKLFYAKDLLLNAEWNKPKDREVNLHRHPAFFGTVEDVMSDCCGFCPKPLTVEEEETAEEEAKVYISGPIRFIQDNPGRQAIGSFNPLTADDWTDMAYVSNTAMLCEAIVDGDVDYIRAWLGQEGNDLNARDWTGRTPLHLAAANSTHEIVQLLIDHGSRLVARLADGRTALHIAAMRGSVEIVSALLRKSEANNDLEERKLDARRAARAIGKKALSGDNEMVGEVENDAFANTGPVEEESDVDMVENANEDGDEDMDATTENSMIYIKKSAPRSNDEGFANAANSDEPDVYDVNVVTWDFAATPLHLAVVKGHVDVVKCLVQDFGADLLIPIKLFNEDNRSARAAILTLVLALQLPAEKAAEMARTLIQLGASIAQADMEQATVLQFCAADSPEHLDMLREADAIGFGRAIKHFSIHGNSYNAEVSSPLLTAIHARDSLTALKLLSLGARSHFTFSDYSKTYNAKFDPIGFDWQTQMFEDRQSQPVILAVELELIDVGKTLIEEHGVDPNTLTTTGYHLARDDRAHQYTGGQSLLDLVREKLHALRKWEWPEQTYEAPLALEADSTYLSEYDAGSYALWSARAQLKSAKERYESEMETYKRNLAETTDQIGVADKRMAVRNVLIELEHLETLLLERGAKTFLELYPSSRKPQENRDQCTNNPKLADRKGFKVEFTFQRLDLSDETQQRYLNLFEAVWSDHTDAVKKLTLLPWETSDGETQPPLRIAVQDQHGFSPFSIAVIQNHFDLASIIMEIAYAQYAPPEDPYVTRYRIEQDQNDSISEGDGDVHLVSEIVDERFTVENIGEVHLQVKSRVAPLVMMNWSFDILSSMGAQKSPSAQRNSGFKYLTPRKSLVVADGMDDTNFPNPSNAHQHRSAEKLQPQAPQSLMQLSIFNNDQSLLTYLLDIGNAYIRRQTPIDGEERKFFFTVDDSDWDYAISADRPALLEEIIKKTGSGIPLNELMNENGIEAKNVPGHYKGLSVHGKKRKDWMAEGRNRGNRGPVENRHPPILQAARCGSARLLGWFLSDATMRCYQEFSRSNQEEDRLRRFSQVCGGFESSVSKFLSAHSHLAIHACITGNRTSDNKGILRYLLSAMPSVVDAKSIDGLTPLHIAFQLYDDAAACMLIDVGADQTCRNESGMNIIHCLLNHQIGSQEMLEKLPLMLDLIDKRLLPALFVERCSQYPGSLTPLAMWLSNQPASHKFNADTLRTLLLYSGGQELNMVNGEGDTPLHVAVRKSNVDLARVIIEHDPSLVNRENATGHTPIELAEDATIAAVCGNPPPMPWDYGWDLCRARKYGLPHRWSVGVLNRDVKTFAKTSGERHESVWDLVRRTQADLASRGELRRKIVTLKEANEVARRLASTQASRSSKSKRVLLSSAAYKQDVQLKTDEVQAWLGYAKTRV